MSFFESLLQKIFSAFNFFTATVEGALNYPPQPQPVYNYPSSVPVKKPVTVSVPVVSSDLVTCARTLWGEARSEGSQGMQAVMNVIRNRVRAGGFGSGYSGVCLKAGQFEAWNSGNVNRPKMLAVTETDAEYRIALDIARRGINGSLVDITGGATYYWTVGLATPSWGKNFIVTAIIGKHKFLRPPVPIA